MIEQPHATGVAHLDAATRYCQSQVIERSGDKLAQRCFRIALTIDASLVTDGAALHGMGEAQRHDRERVAVHRQDFA